MPTISYMLCVLVKNFELVFEEDQKEPVIFKNRSSVCYRLQRSCGKVMFLHVSVILFREGVWQADPPPQADTAPRDDHCSGRDASYWNGFLLQNGFY